MLLELNQPITYWESSAVDGNGDPVLSNGKMILARWVRMDGVHTDANGDDHKTEYIIYSTTSIPKRSIVSLDDRDGETLPPPGARKVFEVIENPSMTNLIKHRM